MELKLYDTLSREKREFRPLDPNNVRMYVCGPTVYDFAHIGNARPVIVFDVLYRLLRHVYGAGHVKYVRNITDVDDKINARAAERGISIRDLTETTYANFRADVAALGCLSPDVEPRATEHIAEMKLLIERLVASGHAYVAEEHVLFSVPSMPDYGKLSKRPLDEMIAGARVDVAPYKRHDQDFVLWKPSKEGEPGWPSPCGISTSGRPGWHIECSAMSWKHLGETFDIHGGGIDLVFPHHENEIAQSRCAFHTGVMANVWMHNGFLQVEGEKMSKSLGNFTTIRELLDYLPGDVIRLQMLLAHYRQPIDWRETASELARNELEDWSHLVFRYYNWKNDRVPHALIEELSDDLNTPNAIAVLREQFAKAKKGNQEDILEFVAACRFLGFKNLDKPGLFEFGTSAVDAGHRAIFDHAEDVMRIRAAIANTAPESIVSQIRAELNSEALDFEVDESGYVVLIGNDRDFTSRVEALVAARNAARAAKNWAESDRIRDELAAMGIKLTDSKEGTTWEVAR